MENYRSHGVDLFWLDEAEPEYTVQDFDLYRYYDGPALECANEYPARYSQTFFDGMKKEGIENPLNLVRCAWVPSAMVHLSGPVTFLLHLLIFAIS